MLKIYNTLSRKIEDFVPLNPPEVGVYTCGPTVYNYAHIGNLRTYVFEDVMVRVLKYAGYKVKRVMNITDVGHLTSNADVGEDKIEKSARTEGKSAWDIANFYTAAFTKDMERLNLLPPDIWCKATDHIKEQIDLIKNLEEKDFVYKTTDGLYFDTSKLSDYGKLAKMDRSKLEEGARVERNPEKKNMTDFALWKFSPKDVKRQMEWDSPWGVGFPGWHIECSAMGMKYLGESFDIHTGGIDHIAVHHTNETAQSEAATGKSFVKYWMHGEFLQIDSKRMGKSEGNFITLETLIDRGFDPLAYRYFTYSAHYRQVLNFSWENLEASARAFGSLREILSEIKNTAFGRTSLSAEKMDKIDDFRKKFEEAIYDDLNMPQVLAVLWAVLKSNIPSGDKFDLAILFDEVLGLRLSEVPSTKYQVPKNVEVLVKKREELRREKKWDEADKVRAEIEKMGFIVEDASLESKVKKI